MNSIEIENLSFAYRGGSPILNIPELTIKSGDHVFLFGPSGSGKTTLLSLITGILVPQAGKLRVLGEDISVMRTGQRDHLRGDRMGYIFQMFNLLPYLTVIENILLPCRMNTPRAARVGGDLAAEAMRLASRLGIESLAQTSAAELSVGQQQRVAAARALMGNPELIIADEPTSALDMDYREDFLELLFENTRNTKATIVFVSHDRSLAQLFDRVVSLPEINNAYSGPAIRPKKKITGKTSRK